MSQHRCAISQSGQAEPFARASQPHFTEENWHEVAKQDRIFAFSETPHYIGRAIVALASDPNIMDKTGQTLATWDLAEEYGFRDLDGTQPHWQPNCQAEIAKGGR